MDLAEEAEKNNLLSLYRCFRAQIKIWKLPKKEIERQSADRGFPKGSNSLMIIELLLSSAVVVCF